MSEATILNTVFPFAVLLCFTEHEQMPLDLISSPPLTAAADKFIWYLVTPGHKPFTGEMQTYLFS